jgi:hypothetical protein
MAIELSNIIFTDLADIVPLSWVEEIVNTGFVNTLAGNDVIIGTGGYYYYGFENVGALNTDDGNDTITGTGIGYGIVNVGVISMGNGEDSIISQGEFVNGYNELPVNSWVSLGDGNDIISSTSVIYNASTINTGNGEDSIISQGKLSNSGGVFLEEGNDSIIVDIVVDTDFPNFVLENFNVIETGDGNDTITSTGIITTRVLLILVMVKTLSLLTEVLMALVLDMVF